MSKLIAVLPALCHVPLTSYTLTLTAQMSQHTFWLLTAEWLDFLRTWLLTASTPFDFNHCRVTWLLTDTVGSLEFPLCTPIFSHHLFPAWACLTCSQLIWLISKVHLTRTRGKFLYNFLSKRMDLKKYRNMAGMRKLKHYPTMERRKPPTQCICIPSSLCCM